MRNLIYLASPYTHQDIGVREQRARQVARFAGNLIKKGLNIFCPIAHSHYIANESELDAATVNVTQNYDKDRVHRMWMEVDLAVLQHCDEMYVYMLDGWLDSKGVREELEFCEQHNIPVTYFDKEGVYSGQELNLKFDGEGG